MRVAVGADHAGYEMKGIILEFLHEHGYETIDLGTCDPEPVDYPDYAQAVGNAVRDGRADRGILLCGSGVGACVAANKLRGIKAALCHDVYSAHQSVEHDNTNVMCLGPRVIGIELAKDLVITWLRAEFTGDERHLRRIAKIDAIEESEKLK
ncbi:MAG: ribose 5-phosphate isomerase B [Armatimonadota bacterium]